MTPRSPRSECRSAESTARGDDVAPSSAASVRPARVALLGLEFDPIEPAAAVDAAERLVRAPGPRWMVTANVQHVALAARDPEVRRVFLAADAITADGQPICWIGRRVGRPLPGRVTGADLIVPLARRCAERGWSVYLFGGSPGMAEEAAKRLVALAPGLVVAGTSTPPLLSREELLDPRHSAPLIESVRRAKPDVLLVALGAPKQEAFIEHHLEALDVPLSIGIGGSLDFLAGRQARAPGWVQALGAEWLHRALGSPFRLGPRYAASGVIFARLALRELRRSRS